MTVFAVLFSDDKTGWSIINGSVEASSGEQAIRKAAAETGAGRYAAVPVRSWTVRDVKVETQTKVSFGSGS